jgi:hypothetical protein
MWPASPGPSDAAAGSDVAGGAEYTVSRVS